MSFWACARQADTDLNKIASTSVRRRCLQECALIQKQKPGLHAASLSHSTSTKAQTELPTMNSEMVAG